MPSRAAEFPSTVRFLRGGHVEATHHVSACLVDAGGAVLAETEPGAGERPVFLRSMAKPFQALCAVEAGVMERFGLHPAHLAAACGIHTVGEDFSRRVAELLAASGCTEAELACGAPRGGSALEHPCAGNHALALALCRARGWPTAGYLEPEHPVQRTMTERLAQAAGLDAAALPMAVDGCGMQAYLLPLGRAAGMYARLASGALGPASRRVAEAMRRHPELIGGPGHIDTALMEAEAGVVAKIGSEGAIGVGLADGRGLALKVHDGAERALDAATVAAVRQGLGLRAASADLERLAAPRVLRLRDGAPVGSCEVRVVLA